MVKASGIYYFHKDHLSSSSLITDESGKIVQETGYLPYGMQRGYSDITLSSYKFTDQEQDSETGLYNYDARLYDPAIGSFITPDSIIPGIYNPLAVNHYAYCLYNPLRFIDPDGHITHDFAGFGNSFDYSAREWRSPGNPKFNAELPEESALKNLIADYNPAVSALDTIVAGIEGDFQGVVLNAAVTVGGRLFRPFKQFGLKGIKATKRLLPGVKFPKGVGKKVA